MYLNKLLISEKLTNIDKFLLLHVIFHQTTDNGKFMICITSLWQKSNEFFKKKTHFLVSFVIDQI